MKTQEQVQSEINTFSEQIQTWAKDSGNSKAYISRANYLTAGEQRQSYNMALSQLKKQVKEQIKEQKAQIEIKTIIKNKIESSNYTRLQLRIQARDLGLSMSGTKDQIAERINNNI